MGLTIEMALAQTESVLDTNESLIATNAKLIGVNEQLIADLAAARERIAESQADRDRWVDKWEEMLAERDEARAERDALRKRLDIYVETTKRSEKEIARLHIAYGVNGC
ncbi:MAG: hypothetical protein GY851_09415 [bacterium]|nr:hypothetical protein [bacterium]